MFKVGDIIVFNRSTGQHYKHNFYLVACCYQSYFQVKWGKSLEFSGNLSILDALAYIKCTPQEVVWAALEGYVTLSRKTVENILSSI